MNGIDYSKIPNANLEVWRHREMLSIDEVALLYAGISPHKCKSIRELKNTNLSRLSPEELYQIERAFVYTEVILDALFVGTLTAHTLMVWDFEGNQFRIDQTDLIRWSRDEIITEKTYLVSNVVLMWMKNKKIKSVTQEVRSHQKQQMQEKEVKQLSAPVFPFPEAPLLQEVSLVQQTYWQDWKEGDKMPSQKVIIAGLTEKGLSEVKAKAVDAVASPVLRHDKSKTDKNQP